MIKAWRKWQLKCPWCNYHYKIEANLAPEWEHCPNCSCSLPFDEFVEYEVEPDGA